MKKNLLIIVALLVVSAHLSAGVKEAPSSAGLAVVSKSTDVYKVIYKNEGSSKVKMNIYNASSKLIYTETVKGDGFIRPLNFSGLYPGEYTIEIEDGNSKRTEKINYQPASIQKKAIHVSRIVGTEEKFLISLAKVENETVTINFYDNYERLIHSEIREISSEFAQIYNLKKNKVSTIEIVDQAGNRKLSRF